MDLLIFALGAMIGVLAGGALVVRHPGRPSPVTSAR